MCLGTEHVYNIRCFVCDDDLCDCTAKECAGCRNKVCRMCMFGRCASCEKLHSYKKPKREEGSRLKRRFSETEAAEIISMFPKKSKLRETDRESAKLLLSRLDSTRPWEEQYYPEILNIYKDHEK